MFDVNCLVVNFGMNFSIFLSGHIEESGIANVWAP